MDERISINAEAEVKKAQQEFSDIVGATVVFLNKNGMEIEFVRKMLHATLDDIVNQLKEEFKND